MLAICQIAQAQRTFRLSDLYFSGGANVSRTPNLNIWEINNLEKDLFSPSSLKPQAIQGIRQFQASGLSSRYNAHMGIMAGWSIKGSRLGQQKLRVGLSAGMYSIQWNEAYRETNEYRIDTLLSQQSGTAYYVDSTHTRNLYYEHLAHMLNVHADYLVYINPRNKLTFYTGVGARFGVSLNNTVSSTYFEHSTINGPNYNDEEYSRFSSNNDDAYSFNSKTLSSTTNMNAYIILGANYRLSKRKRFLKQFHLFHEFNFGLQANHMEVIESSIGFNAGFQSGVRVSLNKRSHSMNKRIKTHRKRY